jgi:CheY-specific phosphatase CheX
MAAPAPAPTEDIARKFGLEALPESVKRLTQMIAKRDGNTEDFARLISQDSDLAARLLRAANPRAKSVEDYVATTVEEALQRTGMSAALLLAMSDPLLRGVLKTFHTMLGIELAAVSHRTLNPLDTEHVLGEVTFAGKATGLVHLRLPNKAIPVIGGKLLGLTADDLKERSVADDVVGELCNMIVGNFKSNLCDAGLDCKLTPPRIRRTEEFTLRVVDGGMSERHGFQASELDFFADHSVNPWND